MSVKSPTSFHSSPEAYNYLVLLFLVSILTFHLLKNKLKTISKPNTPRKKTIKDLRAFKTFPFWTPPPIEGLAVIYRAYKVGIRVSFELWASTNYAPLASLTGPNLNKLVFVSEPELIKKCLSSHDSFLLDKPKSFYDKLVTEIIQDGLFASNYEVWKPHRKILNKIFAYGMLQKQLKVVDSCANQLISDLDKINSSVIKTNQFYPLIYDTAVKIILEILLDPKIVAEKGFQELIDHFRIIKNMIKYRLYFPYYLNDFIWKMSPKGKIQKESILFIQNYFDDGIERVIQLGQMANDCGAVQHMLENKMTIKEIREEMATLIAAGHETTDLTIHYLMQNLGENLDIQRRCQDEVDSVFGFKSSTNMTLDDLAKLKYLEQCILETLRLTPIAPAFGRELKGDIELDNFLIEKGTTLLFCPWMIHRHPDYYQNAEKFDPDRFTQEEVKARHPYAFIPFSSGPRNCIGWKLAMMEVKTIASWILRNYNIYTNDKLANVKLTFEINLMPERKFDLWLKKRKGKCNELVN